MSPASLSAVLAHYVEQELHRKILEAFAFKRIKINRDVIHSKSYLNTTRRNSYTVEVNHIGFVEVKLYVKVFVHHAAAKLHTISELLTVVYCQQLTSHYPVTVSPTVNHSMLFLLGERNVI